MREEGPAVPPPRPPDVVLRLRDTRDAASAGRRLRQALKTLLRRFGLQCIRIEEAPPAGTPTPRGR
jgi:hypothetical protein